MIDEYINFYNSLINHNIINNDFINYDFESLSTMSNIHEFNIIIVIMF